MTKSPTTCSARGCKEPRIAGSSWCAQHAEQFKAIGRSNGPELPAPAPTYLQDKLHKPTESPAPAAQKRRGRPPGSSNRCTVKGCQEKRVPGANRCEAHLEVARKTETDRQKRKAGTVAKARKTNGRVSPPTTTPTAPAMPAAVAPAAARAKAVEYARQAHRPAPSVELHALPEQGKWTRRLYDEYVEFRAKYLRQHPTAPAYLLWLEKQVQSVRAENEALEAMIRTELESLVDYFEGAHELLRSAMEMCSWDSMESAGWEAIMQDGALTIARIER